MSDLIPIKLAEQALANLQSEIDRFKADLTNCKSEADRLKADLDRVTRLYQILLDKSDKQLDYIEDLQLQVDKWQRAESVACDKLLEVCNEVKRLNSELFTCSCANANMNKHMNENARLKAEVERLTKALEEEAACMVGHQENAILIGRLEAEVERLTKAGDAMAKAIRWLPQSISDHHLDAWNAAKEGKQS